MDKKIENVDLCSLLADTSLLRSQAYIAGEWVDSNSNKTFNVINPASSQTITTVPDLGVEEARSTIDAAYEAQKSWSIKTGKERAAIIQKFYHLMLENADDLAKILTAEMGKPLSEAKGEITYGASFLEFYAEEAKRIYGETIPGHQEDKRIIVLTTGKFPSR